MNLITNDCIGAFLYMNVIKENFKNPFMWTRIDLNEFYKLIKLYKEIDFKEIKFTDRTSLKNNLFELCVDQKFNVLMPHMKFDKRCNKVIKRGNDVYYYKIWEYIIDKWYDRLKRMTEEPIFVCHLDYKQTYDSTLDETLFNEIVKYCENNNIKSLFISQLKFDDMTETDYVKKIYFPVYKSSYSHGPQYLIDDYHDLITEKLNELNH